MRRLPRQRYLGAPVRRLLVNDALNQIGERTFWHDLQEWFGMDFVGAPFETLTGHADALALEGTVSLIVRNASYFAPLKASATIPTISLLQDVFSEGPIREMQIRVAESSREVVFNSAYTQSQYGALSRSRVIPLPVDFSVFEPGNPQGLQQALSLPDGCVCWVGASQGAAGHVKGFDIFLQIVRLNPDIPFVAVFKDAMPDSIPPNLRCYVKLPQDELARAMGACRVGLCTSRTESQHLAGTEMGGCGLPLVVPNVGTYWGRDAIGFPGTIYSSEVRDNHPPILSSAITAALRGIDHNKSQDLIRSYWQKEFSKEVVRKQWEALVTEIEHAASD